MPDGLEGSPNVRDREYSFNGLKIVHMQWLVARTPQAESVGARRPPWKADHDTTLLSFSCTRGQGIQGFCMKYICAVVNTYPITNERPV